MKWIALMLGAVCALIAGSARAEAQEPVGAGRVAIESALLGGGALFLPRSGPHETGYVLNAAATENLNRRFGIEGDFAWSMSKRQNSVAGLPQVPNQRTPNMLFYTANI